MVYRESLIVWNHFFWALIQFIEFFSSFLEYSDLWIDCQPYPNQDY